MISNLKAYLKAKKTQTLGALCQEFEVQMDVMRDMLAILVRKGQVKMCTQKPGCGTRCQKCTLSSIETYEWIPISI